MSDTKLSRCEEWSGTHKGIGIQVKRHMASRGTEGAAYPVWCYYIGLHEAQVPEAKRDAFFLPPKRERFSPTSQERITYDYIDCAFANLDSWHCGITYYDYACSIPGHRVVQAGCDWNHLWDHAEEDPYDLRRVEYECRATADELLEQNPDFLVRCGWTGKYFPQDEMAEWGDGFISAEGQRKRDESKSKT